MKRYRQPLTWRMATIPNAVSRKRPAASAFRFSSRDCVAAVISMSGCENLGDHRCHRRDECGAEELHDAEQTKLRKCGFDDDQDHHEAQNLEEHHRYSDQHGSEAL